MLTNGEAKAARPRARPYKLTDAGGLFLHVATTGTKTWRLKYRHRGREKLLTFGRYPALGLPEARTRREEAKEALRAGKDPALRFEQLVTFEQIARAWHGHQKVRWSEAHAIDVIASLERDLFPAIGPRPIREIGAAEILAALAKVEARDRGQTARRLRQRCSAVFGWAISRELASHDPAAQLGRAMLPPAIPRPHAALTEIEDCKALLEACRKTDARPVVVLAGELLALTAVRFDALRGMRWGEVQDLHGEEPLWRVPPARMKLARAKKTLERFGHVVPLSPAAVAVLEAAAREKGYDTRSTSPPADALVFPGRSRGRPLWEGALRDLYARSPFGDRHVPHGWRASFSTILNEHLPECRNLIDQALAHTPKDRVEAAYNRAEQLRRRRALFDTWGTLLTG